MSNPKTDRYHARKFVSDDKEHPYSESAPTRDELVRRIAKRDDRGYYNVYDLQPPEPGVDEIKIGEIVCGEQGTRWVKP